MIMKQINIKLFMVAALFVVATGCNDEFFDVIPTESMTDVTFWKSERDVEMALTACYNNWEMEEYPYYMDCEAGNGYSQYGWEGFLEISSGTQGKNGTYWDYGRATLWNYERITRYNTFLQKIVDVDMDADKKASYTTQVRFLRAYNYARKVNLFGDVPLVTQPFATPAEAAIGRTPAADVKKFIYDELQAIANSDALPEQNDAQAGGRITRGAAYALLARQYLYDKDYTNALANAKKVIAMPCFAIYTGGATPEENYLGNFRKANQSSSQEIILAHQRQTPSYTGAVWGYTLPSDYDGWSSVVVIKSLVDAYEMADGTLWNESYAEHPFDNRDPRLNMTVLNPGSTWDGVKWGWRDGNNNSRSGIYLKKYLKPYISMDEAWDSDADMPLFRLAEMYLTFAEAAFYLNQETGTALGYINELRQRAGHVPATALTEDLIRRERRIELCFEGLFWDDVRRWDWGSKVFKCNAQGYNFEHDLDANGDAVLKKENGTAYVDIYNRDYDYVTTGYLLMIPQGEIDANPQMKQNLGY
ncbi:membrane protein [Bacteroidia bacterium]|nr:membrane protein [Bacteroidia bacterium]